MFKMFISITTILTTGIMRQLLLQQLELSDSIDTHIHVEVYHTYTSWYCDVISLLGTDHTQCATNKENC